MIALVPAGDAAVLQHLADGAGKLQRAAIELRGGAQQQRVHGWQAGSDRNLTQQGTDDQPMERQDDGQISPPEPVVGLDQRRRGDIPRGA